jgi:hypothetical protein
LQLPDKQIAPSFVYPDLKLCVFGHIHRDAGFTVLLLGGVAPGE